MKIGCHVSVAKGFYQAAVRADNLGARSFQVFTKNPRALRSKKIDVKDMEQGRELCAEKGISVVSHTPYITNLSTPKTDLHELTIRSLKEDLQIAEAYGAVGAVVHCGKHVGEGEEYGTKRMVETLNLILEDFEGKTLLLLENTAGQGTELGLKIEDLCQIREASLYPEKLGFCFDTCHGFASGIWNFDSFNDLIDLMKKTGYLEGLKAIHFNDSKVPYNSRKDRHAKIGKGEIGAEALTLFLHEKSLDHLPIVLETPVDDESEYKEEIKYLLQLKQGEGSVC